MIFEMSRIAKRKAVARRSDRVRLFDPFGGSGTTLTAAELTGRRARLIELDPKYADVIVQRWEADGTNDYP